jgi:NAD(P)-dependent dehydrogenase (short-subunit alcohol dehydrogenase family)
VDSYFGESGLAAYCASKGAVKSLTDAAALACAENGYKIRVNAVHPGLVHTNLTEKEAKELDITFEQYEKIFASHTPLGRIGKPIDIAYTDLFLASDESLWVTGSDIVIDGGLLASGGLSNRPKPAK